MLKILKLYKNKYIDEDNRETAGKSSKVNTIKQHNLI
jgi:hypothetical protein